MWIWLLIGYLAMSLIIFEVLLVLSAIDTEEFVDLFLVAVTFPYMIFIKFLGYIVGIKMKHQLGHKPNKVIDFVRYNVTENRYAIVSLLTVLFKRKKDILSVDDAYKLARKKRARSI